MEEFYEDYEPRFYERTYSTYLGSSAYDNIFDDGVRKQGDVHKDGNTLKFGGSINAGGKVIANQGKLEIR